MYIYIFIYIKYTCNMYYICYIIYVIFCNIYMDIYIHIYTYILIEHICKSYAATTRF